MRLLPQAFALVMVAAVGCSPGAKPMKSPDTNRVQSRSSSEPHPGLYTRILLVEKLENLNKIKGLDQTRSLEEKLLEYLKMNSLALELPSYASLDEATKALTLHATMEQLDKVEFVLSKLRDIP